MNIEKTQNNSAQILMRFIILCFCMFIAVGISYLFFQNQSLRLDESQSLWQSSHSSKMIISLIGQDVHVPLYPLLLHVWLFIFGTGIPVARTLSLIFFILSIPVFYILGKRLYTKDTSLFATVLFSISPFMNWYANEIRMYSLFVFVALVHMYFLIGILKNDSRRSWVGFTVSSLVGVYTHYFFFLLLFVDFLFYLSNRKKFALNAFKNFLRVALVTLVAFLPWITYVFYLGKVSNASPNLLSPTSVDLFNMFSEFFIGFQNDFVNTIFLSLWPIIILLGFLALRRNMVIQPGTIYLIMIFSIPTTIAFFGSIYIRPIFLSRYLIFTMPAMYLLMGWILSRYPRFLMYILSCLAVLTFVFGFTVEGLSDTTPTKENYREVAAYLEANALPSDIIVASAPFTIYPFIYYYHGPSKVTTLPVWDQNKVGPIPSFKEDELPGDINSITKDHTNMWLILSYDQGYSEKIRIYLDTHYQRLVLKNFSPGLVLYEYKFSY